MKTFLALIMLCSIPVNAKAEGYGNGGSKDITIDINDEFGGGFGF